MITKILKKIRRMFYFFGIDIKFVKKHENISAIEHNSKEARDKFYTDSKKIKKYLEINRLKFYEKIANVLNSNNISLDNNTVSDVGCGPGKLFHFIDKKYNVKKFVGYDFSPEAINLAKTIFPKGEFYVYDIYKQNNQKFDFVFCTEVIEHLLYPEKALNNLIAMLNDKAMLLITVPNGRIDKFEGHINFYSPESWDVFITQNIGNRTVKFGFINNNLFALIKN